MAKNKPDNIYVWIGLNDELYCTQELYKRNYIGAEALTEMEFPQGKLDAYLTQDLDVALSGRNLEELIDSEDYEPIGACVAEDVADAMIYFSGVEGGRWTVRSTRENRQVGHRDIIFHLSGGVVYMATFGGMFMVDLEGGFFANMQKKTQAYVNVALQL